LHESALFLQFPRSGFDSRKIGVILELSQQNFSENSVIDRFWYRPYRPISKYDVNEIVMTGGTDISGSPRLLPLDSGFWLQAPPQPIYVRIARLRPKHIGRAGLDQQDSSRIGHLAILVIDQFRISRISIGVL
jgi:hypothetical protein